MRASATVPSSISGHAPSRLPLQRQLRRQRLLGEEPLVAFSRQLHDAQRVRGVLAHGRDAQQRAVRAHDERGIRCEEEAYARAPVVGRDAKPSARLRTREIERGASATAKRQ